MADHFEEVIGPRVAALEARVAAEAESVKEHFAELQNFITFSVVRQITQLKEEVGHDLRRVEQRLDRLEQRFDGLEQRFDGLEHRFESLDRKFDAHHEAIKLILSDILARLPASRG